MAGYTAEQLRALADAVAGWFTQTDLAVLRRAADELDHPNWTHHPDTRSGMDADLTPAELRTENARLRRLVTELTPYLLTDVTSGLDFGYPGGGHPDDDGCDDCVWYRESLAWKARIDAGELGDITIDLPARHHPTEPDHV